MSLKKFHQKKKEGLIQEFLQVTPMVKYLARLSPMVIMGHNAPIVGYNLQTF
jgi:hypothetical protein